MRENILRSILGTIHRSNPTELFNDISPEELASRFHITVEAARHVLTDLHFKGLASVSKQRNGRKTLLSRSNARRFFTYGESDYARVELLGPGLELLANVPKAAIGFGV